MENSYQRPPIGKFDPGRVNGLWKKIQVVVGDLTDTEVVAALAAAGVTISRSRVSAWSRAETSDKFSPMNIAELESVLSALAKAAQDNRGPQ